MCRAFFALVASTRELKTTMLTLQFERLKTLRLLPSRALRQKTQVSKALNTQEFMVNFRGFRYSTKSKELNYTNTLQASNYVLAASFHQVFAKEIIIT
jgi:hypothetical protein